MSEWLSPNRRTHVEKMNAVVMHVHTDKDKSQMKVELKPLGDASQKVETKSRN